MFIGNLARTPAPIKDRVKGSRVNKPGSASGSRGKIVFSDSTTKAIKTIIAGSRVKLATAKAVVRRGFGAYSTSYRPGISRNAWGLARLKTFLKKVNGEPVKKAYVQDDDLIRNL